MWKILPLIIFTCLLRSLLSLEDENFPNNLSSFQPKLMDGREEKLSLIKCFRNTDWEGILQGKCQGRVLPKSLSQESWLASSNYKRSNYRPVKNSNCNCLSHYEPRDLGRQYYPRYLSEALCENNLCHNRTQTCQKKYYKFKVLRELYEDEARDDQAPQSLRDQWVFQDISIAVTCECVSKNTKNPNN